MFHGRWFGDWGISRKSSGADGREGLSAGAGGRAGEGWEAAVLGGDQWAGPRACIRGEEDRGWTRGLYMTVVDVITGWLNLLKLGGA